MTKVILYIAISLDGYIARPDGSLDWLTSTPSPETGDYGYTDLLNSIDTTIMGRKTYEEVIGFGIDWPYADKKSFVVTTNSTLPISSPNTFISSEDCIELVSKIKASSSKNCWLIGGGMLISEFLNKGLIDQMIITIIPKIIGEGIPLFPNKTIESTWKVSNVESFPTNVVMVTYDKQ